MRPTDTKRGSSSGTLTRAKRSSPLSGSRTKSPRLSDSGEIYGNGWPGPTASGVSTGYTSCSKRSASSASSFSLQSAMRPITIPSAASAGLSSRFQIFACSVVWTSTRSRISASVWRGARPSGEWTLRPETACSVRAPTLTAKNSSRFREKIEQNLTRSRSGTSGSATSSRTRALKSSQDSSRLRRRSAASALAGESVAGTTSVAPRACTRPRSASEGSCVSGAAVHLFAQLTHENVDRPVAAGQPAAPDPLEELVPREHPSLVEGERVEEPELGGRQLDVHAVNIRLEALRVDHELLDLEKPPPRLASCARTPRRAATRTRATSSFIEKGFTR